MYTSNFEHALSLRECSSGARLLEKRSLTRPQYWASQPRHDADGTQLSPFGVIPKSNQPGKWRLIGDLSSPDGRSVNDGIEEGLCSLSYLHLDEVVESGRGTELANMDIESAYGMVPVHPGDRPLLAVQWAGQSFFDTKLPFGLRSASKIFTAVADALQWVFQQQGVPWVAHYLDDYITMGPPHSELCRQNLEEMLSSCRRWGGDSAREVCRTITSDGLPRF